MARLTKFSQFGRFRQIDGNRGNAYEFLTGDGRHLMISYETLVAGFHPTMGWLVTDKYWSKSTQKQIENYFLNNDAQVNRVSQSTLQNALGWFD